MEETIHHYGVIVRGWLVPSLSLLYASVAFNDGDVMDVLYDVVTISLIDVDIKVLVGYEVVVLVLMPGQFEVQHIVINDVGVPTPKKTIISQKTSKTQLMVSLQWYKHIRQGTNYPY